VDVLLTRLVLEILAAVKQLVCLVHLTVSAWHKTRHNPNTSHDEQDDDDDQ